jgi:hypothetical protein
MHVLYPQIYSAYQNLNYIRQILSDNNRPNQVSNTNDLIGNLPHVLAIQNDLSTHFPDRNDHKTLALLLFNVYNRPNGKIHNYRNAPNTSSAWQAQDIQQKLKFLMTHGYLSQDRSGMLEVSPKMALLCRSIETAVPQGRQ